METAATHAKPPRGIIVLDTSALLPLCLPIPKEHLTDQALLEGQKHTLADSLFYLARHGYEVHIPAMVAYECGEYMPDSTPLKNYFTTSTKPAIAKKVKWDHLFEPFMQKFIRLQKEGLPVFIDPALPEDHSPVANFLRQLNSIHMHAFWSDDNKANKIASVKRDFPLAPKHGLGEQQAAMLINSFSERNVPIFFLSDDRACLTTLEEKCPGANVHFLTPLAYYKALHTHQLIEASCSMKPISLSTFLSFQADAGKPYQERHVLPNQEIFENLDRPLHPELAMDIHHPFSYSAGQLAQDLKKEKEEAPPPPSPDAPSTDAANDRIARFNARYGKQASRTQPPGTNSNEGRY